MPEQPTNPVQYRLGQPVRYLTHPRDAFVTGFFMNQPEPSDPEANLFLTGYNIDQYPHLLIAPGTPDPTLYFAIEIGFSGSFVQVEVRREVLAPLQTETSSECSE